MYNNLHKLLDYYLVFSHFLKDVSFPGKPSLVIGVMHIQKKDKVFQFIVLLKNVDKKLQYQGYTMLNIKIHNYGAERNP